MPSLGLRGGAGEDVVDDAVDEIGVEGLARQEDLLAWIDLVRWGRLDVTGFISAVLPLTHAPEGVPRLATKDGDPIRIILTPAPVGSWHRGGCWPTIPLPASQAPGVQRATRP